LLPSCRTCIVVGSFLLFDAENEEYCAKAAHDAGLSVSTEELQHAANEFRARRGLSSASQPSTFHEFD